MFPYDAILFVSFGGPEGPADVMPFLENVTRGRNIPRDRLAEVAHHYEAFGGVSPINQQTRELIAALEAAMGAGDTKMPRLPVYWGNRNWHPMLAETMKRMAADGVRRAVAFVVAAYSSYSSCRQYRENIEAARAAVGPAAPAVDKLRVFYNHPGFIEPMIDRTIEAVARLPEALRDEATLVFTAHSIPYSMATGCRYELQLREASRLVAAGSGRSDWTLVYQSRSGPPTQPWLGPDVCEYLRQAKAKGQVKAAVLVPIGFLSDHMEVLYDLDHEAKEVCQEIGLPMERAGTVGAHPRFARMIRQLIEERAAGDGTRPAMGEHPASHDVCPVDCCLPPARPAAPA
jgi:ferrochelatase